MIAKSMVAAVSGSSMIRKMFEEGIRLKSIYGEENVYDFSLGNPDLAPPAEVIAAMHRHADAAESHMDMPNAGFVSVREKVADYLTRQGSCCYSASNILMTVGAAGGINVTLRSILDPGDEVLVLAPYFAEYGAYITGNGGVKVEVATQKDTFLPDTEAIADAITARTKAIILNSPNNPTGVIYPASSLMALSDVLQEAEKKYGTSICVISDEPYTALCYDGEKAPMMSDYFKNVVIISSFSKSLSLPGERIGYAAVSPYCEDGERLIAAMTVTNRTMGFVNAPSLMQLVVGDSLDIAVNVEEYRARRDLFYDMLTSLGFECLKPQGAFYLFPKCPIADDKAFAEQAAKHNILVVPGSGFAGPGYFRVAYCVDRKVIERSYNAFKALAEDYKEYLK